MALARYEHQGAAPATTLANSMSAGDTSFQVASGTGYPTGAGGKLFVIAVDPGQPSEEKILCSARSGVTFTVNGGAAGRGYDNTSATAHTAPTAVVQHVFAATEADDANDHIYTTSRDDHTQYLRTDGTRAGTGTQNFGGPVVSTSVVTGTAFNATGITGSTQGRYVGRSSGAPSSGAHLTADFTDDPAGLFWICTAGGTPGTWIGVGVPGIYRARATRTTDLNTTTSSLVLKFDTKDFDPNTNYSTATGLYTCPTAGYYRVSASVGYNTLSGVNQVSIRHNGTDVAIGYVPASGSILVSDEISCAANDTLGIYTITTTGTSAMAVGIANTNVVFERMA